MALPDYASLALGTAIVIRDSGGTGGTVVMTLDALADATARQSAAFDLGATWDEEYGVWLVVETGTAPTAGNTVELYLACSPDNTLYPAGLGTGDAAWPGDSNEDEWKLQLGPPVVILYATNDGNVAQCQGPVIWRPASRYVVAVIDNNLGQAFRDQATAANNLSRVILMPRRYAIQDS